MKESRAINAILMAALMGSLSAGGFFWAHQLDPLHSSSVAMFLRIIVSFICLFAFAKWEGSRVEVHSWRNGKYLWMWGLLGALTFAAYFQSVVRIGSGPATLLNAGGGVIIAGLAPRKQHSPNSIHLIGAVGAFLGLLLFSTSLWQNGLNLWGAILGLTSGLSASFAYLLVSKVGRSPSTATVALHWSLVNLLVISAWLFAVPGSWPHSAAVWAILFLSSIAMSVSQFLTAFAFQHGTASLIACLGFLAPLMSLSIDSLLFGRKFTVTCILGAGLVVGFGLFIPLKSWLKAKDHWAVE